MVMANKHGIDFREFVDLTSWRAISFRNLFLCKDGVDEEVIRANLYDGSRMAYPCVSDIFLSVLFEVSWHHWQFLLY